MLRRVRRDPFELWLVVTCGLTGTLSLLPLRAPRTDAISRLLPSLAPTWYVGLAVAGLLTTVGIVWPVRSLRSLNYSLGCERVGLALLAGWLTGFGAALEVISPRTSVGLLLLGLGFASVVRLRQIAHELRVVISQAVATYVVVVTPDDHGGFGGE